MTSRPNGVMGCSSSISYPWFSNAMSRVNLIPHKSISEYLSWGVGGIFFSVFSGSFFPCFFLVFSLFSNLFLSILTHNLSIFVETFPDFCLFFRVFRLFFRVFRLFSTFFLRYLIYRILDYLIYR